MPLLVVGLSFVSPVLADDGRPRGENDRALRLLSLTPVPVSKTNTTPGMYVFDISFVDQATQTYYLADRSNAAVDVVNAATGAFVTQIAATPAFAGFVSIGGVAHNELSGPDGVVAAFPFLFVTDAGSRVVSFDLRTTPPTQVSDVTTKSGDPLRADELAYDPEDGLILAINNADTPPFGTLISVDKNTGKLTVGAQIVFDAAHGVDAQNGAEQPIWDPSTHRFYLSIPQIGGTLSSGGVIRINPATAKVETTFPVSSCGPAGLSRGPGNDGRHDALIGCNTVFDTSGTTVWSPTGTAPADPRDVIIDLNSGNIDALIFGAGAGDEVWYNPGDNNYYATGSGSPLRPLPATASGATPLAVIDAADQKLESLVPTFNVAALTTGPAASQHPASTAHSIAANSANNHVFVPIGGNNALLSPDGKTNCLTGCIAIFGHPDEDTDRADNDRH
ncbi:MAG TPA: hypothetical protein VGR70_00445 [Stellaceae bacterium]|nr:hypothetical protein [Stellaceae bacterium]